MEYLFNNLDGTSFQRLFNSILLARFGADVRLTPLHGPDGGRDAETAPGNPFFEFQIAAALPDSLFAPLPRGRYLFQAKHHRTTDVGLTVARRRVVADFETELKANVLSRCGDQAVNYFILVTNVPSSDDALKKVDEKRKALLQGSKQLHADIWWQEQLVAFLDQMPSLWAAYPDLFPGRVPPFLVRVASAEASGIPRAVRLALGQQYRRESNVKFQQIDLRQILFRLFVDLDVSLQHVKDDAFQRWFLSSQRHSGTPNLVARDESPQKEAGNTPAHRLVSALGLLLQEHDELRDVSHRILIEGGPGQGKSCRGCPENAAQGPAAIFIGGGEPAAHRQLLRPSASICRFLRHNQVRTEGRMGEVAATAHD